MVGLEMQANKVLGDKGYFSKDFIKRIFKIPENVESNSKSRQRRSAGESAMWAYIDQLHELVSTVVLVPVLISFPKLSFVFASDYFLLFQYLLLEAIEQWKNRRREMSELKQSCTLVISSCYCPISSFLFSILMLFFFIFI